MSAEDVNRNTVLLDPRQSQFDAVWGSYGMA